MNKQDQKTKLKEFVDVNLHRLVKHAYFRIGNLEDAEDIVQDVLTKMIVGNGFDKSIRNPLTYAYRMIANRCIDKHRLVKKTKICSLEEIPENEVQVAGNIETEMIRQEDFKRINDLLASIPLDQAEVLRLRIVDGLHFPDIAEVLDQPLTTIKSRFKYGLDKLKNHFLVQKEVIHEL